MTDGTLIAFHTGQNTINIWRSGETLKTAFSLGKGQKGTKRCCYGHIIEGITLWKTFKRVHDSIKPSVWSLASASNLSEQLGSVGCGLRLR